MKLNFRPNAHGEESFPDVRVFACIFLLLLLIWVPFRIREAQSSAEAEQRARRAMAECMIPTMNRLTNIARKMQYAGADIQGVFLEDIKTYAFSLSEMNHACANAFGSAYAPVDEGYMRRVMNAVYELERKYLEGENASQAEKTLAMYLMKFEQILELRFTEDADIRIIIN